MIFPFGAYYVTGVAALASSVIAIVIVILASAEVGKHAAGRLKATVR
ncbi:MAG: hypothetical protein ACXV3S_02080 [Kineosporiaceae bacterium]